MKKLILASTSPRRKEILSKLDIPFEIIPSSYEEDMTLDKDPRDLVAFLSREKALAVSSTMDEDAIIIGADTIVVLDNAPLGKPKDTDDAKRMLEALSGKTHEVMTGITLIEAKDNTVLVSEAIVATVTIKALSESEIDAYIASGEPMDKAGAYAIQEKGGIFVSHIDGDFFTIMGLPLYWLSQALSSAGIEMWQ